MASAAESFNSLAGQLNTVTSSLKTLGIDMTALQTTAAAFQLIGGSGQVIAGIIAAKESYNAVKAAEGTAHLAKYGPYALAVGAVAVAGGYAMGQLIERAVNVPDNGAGMRGLLGGTANVTRY